MNLLSPEEHSAAASTLLDYFKNERLLKNDAAISRALNVQPPTISKLRSGRIPMGPTILLTLMEELGIKAAKLRYLVGDKWFDHCIWKNKVARGESNVRSAVTFELYPNQKLAIGKMHDSLEANGYAVLRAGHRAGKSVVVGSLLTDLEFDILCVMTDGASAEHLDWPWKKKPGQHILHNQMPVKSPTPGREAIEQNPKRVVVFIDEPFWKFGAHLTFQVARKAGYKIIVSGSRGPEWDNCPFWRSLEGQGWNTWDLNPACTRESLEKHYVTDAAKACRDFEAF